MSLYLRKLCQTKSVKKKNRFFFFFFFFSPRNKKKTHFSHPFCFLASTTARRGVSSGRFQISLHQNVGTEPFWSSKPFKWSKDRVQDRLQWLDIDLDKAKVHLGIGSLVVTVWFMPDGSNETFLEAKWGVNLSGLECLGSHPPAHCRLPANTIVFYMCGSYFVAPKDVPNRPLHLNAKNAVKSYDTGLVLRLHRMQRALHQIASANARLKNELSQKGVMEESKIKEHVENGLADKVSEEKPSLRDQVFRVKKSKTERSRITETHLKLQLEMLNIRLGLLKREVNQKKDQVSETRNEADRIREANNEQNFMLMDQLRSVSRDKLLFKTWSLEFRTKAINSGLATRALKEVRLNLVRGLSEILYPIGNGAIATIRWVALPEAGQPLREFSSKNETVVSVAVGWLAHLCHLISCIVDVPLRHPVKLMGSFTSIVDQTKETPEEYPLYVKGNSDWNKFELGVCLLAKNVAQLRWYFNTRTKDLKALLPNVQHLFTLGKSDEDVIKILRLLPPIPTLVPPPTTTVDTKRLAVSPVVSPVSTLTSASTSKSTSPSKSIGSSDEMEPLEVGIEAKEGTIFGSCPRKIDDSAGGLSPKPRINCNDDDFWTSATNQSIALLSNPANFQQGRTSNQRPSLNHRP